jgi:hypothetical protein
VIDHKIEAKGTDMRERPDAEGLCREALRAGATREEIIRRLHDSGANILDAIKAVRATFCVSLGEAKRLVAEHPVWNAEVKAAGPLQEALIQAFEEERDDGEHRGR